MHISKLEIRNFRNFANASFHFDEGVNTLIGENGSGKTNAFYAIRLLLDDSLSRRAAVLRDSDFNRAIGNWRGHWITISMKFEQLDASEGCQIIRHTVGHMSPENKGTYSYYFRPKKEVRKKLFERSEAGLTIGELDVLRSEISIDDYEFVFTGRANADLTDENNYKKFVGDFETPMFPDPDEDDIDQLGVPTPTLHKDCLLYTFPSPRDQRGYRMPSSA